MSPFKILQKGEDLQWPSSAQHNKIATTQRMGLILLCCANFTVLWLVSIVLRLVSVVLWFVLHCVVACFFHVAACFRFVVEILLCCVLLAHLTDCFIAATNARL